MLVPKEGPRYKLGRPTDSKKFFYSKRLNPEDQDLDELLDFGISYTINSRIQKIPIDDPDRFFYQALFELKGRGYTWDKLLWVIRGKMCKVKLGGEVFRTISSWR